MKKTKSIRERLECEIIKARDEFSTAVARRWEAQNTEQAAFQRLRDAERKLRTFDFPEIEK